MVFVVAEHVRRISYSVGAHGLILVQVRLQTKVRLMFATFCIV